MSEKLKPFAVKVQVSLASSDGKSKTLVYNKDRSIRLQIDTPLDVKERMGSEVKAFFMARIEGNDLVLENKIADQGW